MTWAPGDLLSVEAVGQSLKQLENELGQRAKYFPAQSKVRTTAATVTTLHTVMVPVNHTLLVTGYVVARRTGGSAGTANDGAGYAVTFVAKNTSGTAAIIGSATVTALGESQAAWDVTCSASGGDVLVRVAGAANNNITWTWTGKSVSVSS